jgi:hypothetical protein
MNQYYEYLDFLRKSGVTNMFGAAPYLEDRFDLSRQQAKSILIEWMKHFGEKE